MIESRRGTESPRIAAEVLDTLTSVAAAPVAGRGVGLVTASDAPGRPADPVISATESASARAAALSARWDTESVTASASDSVASFPGAQATATMMIEQMASARMVNDPE